MDQTIREWHLQPLRQLSKFSINRLLWSDLGTKSAHVTFGGAHNVNEEASGHSKERNQKINYFNEQKNLSWMINSSDSDDLSH